MKVHTRINWPNLLLVNHLSQLFSESFESSKDWGEGRHRQEFTVDSQGNEKIRQMHSSYNCS